jgi:glycine cleavage system regulatory protein
LPLRSEFNIDVALEMPYHKLDNRVVITACGPDKVGFTASIANVISGNEANVEESKMTRLGDSFSMMLLVNVPPKFEESLKKQLEEIKG